MTDKNELAEARLALAGADMAGMALVRENERLRSEIEQIKLITDWAEIDRLRAAMQQAITRLEYPTTGGSIAECDASAWDAVDILRQALGRSKVG